MLTEFIRPNNLTVYRVAKDSGIPQPTLQLIVTGKRAITADTALKLATYFDLDAQFWLNLQSEYDLRLTKQQIPLHRNQEIMKTFSSLQTELDKLIRLPTDLPTVYLIGGTGAGKTCLMRQILGTADLKFPSAGRFRTTVAPAEFIITNEPELKAAFVFKSEKEVSELVSETLETAISDSIAMRLDAPCPNVEELLAESADQRFRLRHLVRESDRRRLADKLEREILPQVRSWSENEFPNEEDSATVVALALERFADGIRGLHSEMTSLIADRVRELCGLPAEHPFPESHVFSDRDRNSFISKLKLFLGVEDGSIASVVEKGRIRGRLKSPLIAADVQLAVTDAEGIGHDAKEARVLSARHFDYFYASDSILLVEDAEKPFTGGGQSALAAIATSGYLSKLTLAFSRLDKIQDDEDDRQFQIKEVNKSLRNALSALRKDGLRLAQENLGVRYFAHMNGTEPDAETKAEITKLVGDIVTRHGEAKASFVRPHYDFELLSGHLAGATVKLRRSWQNQISGAEATKWQTQKAFTKRMDRKDEEFRSLKPVAEFREVFLKALDSFLSNPQRWENEITEEHKKQCLDYLKQELSNQILQYVRSVLLDREHPEWKAAADISGRGTTPIRSKMILDVINESAPELTSPDAKDFKDAVKQLILSSVSACDSKAKKR